MAANSDDFINKSVPIDKSVTSDGFAMLLLYAKQDEAPDAFKALENGRYTISSHYHVDKGGQPMQQSSQTFRTIGTVDMALIYKRLDIAKILVGVYSHEGTWRYNELLLKEVEGHRDSLMGAFNAANKSGEITPWTFFGKFNDIISESETVFLDAFQQIELNQDYLFRVRELIETTNATQHSRGFQSKLDAMAERVVELEIANPGSNKGHSTKGAMCAKS